MARRQLVKGWDWVKTERVFLPEPPKKEKDRRASNAEALKTVAITAGVVAGLLGLFWFQRQQPDAPEIVYMQAPEPEPVRQLELLDANDPFVEARVRAAAVHWVERAREGSFELLYRLIWADVFPFVAYPGPAEPGEHPSVQAMRALMWRSIWLAAAEVSERDLAAGSGAPSDETASNGQAPVSNADATPSVVVPQPGAASQPIDVLEAKMPVSEKVEALTSEWPSPGRFVRLDPELAERGIECLAVRALGSVVVRAAKREGGSLDKAQAHMRELMMNAPLCLSYAKLIEQSEWNAGYVKDLRAGQLLWLPPIRTKRLLDRRRPAVTLEPRPWPDGSRRLEPPPTIWT